MKKEVDILRSFLSIIMVASILVLIGSIKIIFTDGYVLSSFLWLIGSAVTLSISIVSIIIFDRHKAKKTKNIEKPEVLPEKEAVEYQSQELDD